MSVNFPTTLGAPSENIDAFVTKLGPDGRSLMYSTFLGNNFTQAFAMSVDGTGAAFVTGSAYAATRSDSDVFVRKLAPNGGTLLFDQSFGGGADDVGYGITIGPDGGVFVVGVTESPGFPIDGFGDGAGANAFVVKLSGTRVSMTQLGAEAPRR